MGSEMCIRDRAVSMLGKFQDDPAPRHWKALKHVCRYVKGTADMGIIFPRRTDRVGLQAWSDADWARDESHRHSRSGYLISYDESPILWSSRLQTATALSTTEAEFTALSSCVRDVIWLRAVLSELGMTSRLPTTVFQDNLGAIAWTDEVQGLRRVKHVGIRYHFVRGSVERREVEIVYTPSAENKADSLTKVLAGQLHDVHRRYLGVE